MAKKMVRVQATKTAVTTVRGERMRYNVVTNADKKAADAAEEAGEANTHTFTVEKDIADQLVSQRVAKIIDKDVTVEAEDDGAAAATPGTTARRRVAKNAEEDAEAGESVSGADTRDTTAFANDPVAKRGATNPAPAGEEAPDADAPPADDDSGSTKKASTKKKS